MRSDKYTGKTDATQRMGLWVAIAALLVAGVALYFVYDRSLVPIFGARSSAAVEAPAR